MNVERQMKKACWVGIVSILLAACSDSGGSDDDANGSLGGAGTTGGAATGGAANTGGTPPSTGGTQPGTGGTGPGTGGTPPSTGGTQPGTGGTQPGTGGTQPGTGGTQPGTGGTQPGTGGTQPGTGGTEPGTGGTEPGTGGTEPGTGGTEPGTGGTDPGTGGTDPGTGGTDPGTGGTDPGTGGTAAVTVLLAGDDVTANGPLQTTVENLSFSGGGHILVRPRDITTEPNTKHPVAIWGPGGGSTPGYYESLLTRMASHGFVVVGIRESSGGSELMSAAIDWLEDQNGDSGSPMYDRLILDRVGVFGHSMGGLSSEATALADDRVATALLDNSGSLSHDGLVNVRVPVGIIYGEDGMERENAEADYNNPGNQGPCWMSMMAGGGHGSGPWDGAAANVAWMRWHIGGENFRKDAFIGDGGAFNNQGIWTTQFKNWDGWKNWNE